MELGCAVGCDDATLSGFRLRVQDGSELGISAGDFNGDGKTVYSSTTLRRGGDGGHQQWVAERLRPTLGAWSNNWDVLQVTDFNADGLSDVLLQSHLGAVNKR